MKQYYLKIGHISFLKNLQEFHEHSIIDLRHVDRINIIRILKDKFYTEEDRPALTRLRDRWYGGRGDIYGDGKF